MKRITITNLVLLCLILFSCSPEKKNEQSKNKIQDRRPKAENGEIKHFHHYTEDFQRLMLGYEGAIRKVDIKMKKEQVRSVETATLMQESESSITYKVWHTDDELIVVKYEFSSEVLQAIKVKIELKDNESFETILAELTDFFTHKYGIPKITPDKNEVWQVVHHPEHEVDIIDFFANNKFVIEVDIS